MNIYLSEKEKDNKTDQEAKKSWYHKKSLYIWFYIHIFFYKSSLFHTNLFISLFINITGTGTDSVVYLVDIFGNVHDIPRKQFRLLG